MLFLLVSCAASEEDQLMQEYRETERINLYLQWKEACKQAGMVIFAHRPYRACRRSSCIPSRWDWDWDFEHDRPRAGNSYRCVTHADIDAIMRQMQ